MPADERVLALLERREELRHQGKEVSAEELCADCPDRLEELKQHLRDVASMHSFLQLTREQPVVLFIDDIQWIDDDSAAVLAHLRETFAPGSEHPLMIIVAARDPKTIEHLELKEAENRTEK